MNQDTTSQQPNTAPAAPDNIDVAPPAYAPRSPAGPQDASQVSNSPPAPVKEMPADLNAPHVHPPMAPGAPAAPGVPGAPQQPAYGVVPIPQLSGEQPQWIDCPFCQQRTLTRVTKDGTPMQVVAGVLCCLLCVCLACLPCMAGWFEETTYFCSHCNNKVALRPDSGPIVVYAPTAVVPSKHVAA
ncbi:hypothetical protein P885DRAFT_81627 [Corynascus similis CBS 632.67]